MTDSLTKWREQRALDAVARSLTKPQADALQKLGRWPFAQTGMSRCENVIHGRAALALHEKGLADYVNRRAASGRIERVVVISPHGRSVLKHWQKRR